MKKILFLNSFYYPKYNVNGICSNEIVKFLKNNYSIFTLSYKNSGEQNFYEHDGEKIYKVKPRLFFLLRDYSESGSNVVLKKIFKFLAFIIQKFKRAVFIFWYPFTSIIATRRYIKTAENIFLNNNIDCVIAVFQPYETILAADYLKKKYGVKEIIYVLDTLSNVNNKDTLLNKILRDKGRKLEKKYYSCADLVISMRCHEKNFNCSFYDDIRNKIVFSDIPLFRKLDKVESSNKFDHNYINLVYTGTLDKERRDPSKICQLFEHYNKSNFKKINAHFYSRGNCEEILGKYKSIIRHGFVKNDISVQALFEADALISIEAKNSDMISAKIFEYMSTGKKIIHFFETDNDVLIPYLKKYSNALIINVNYDIDSNIDLINNFLELPTVESANLESLFIENTPSYTACIIDEFLGGDSNDRY